MEEQNNRRNDGEDIADLSIALVKRLEDKKAQDILIYDVRKMGTGLGDFFVLVTANSTVQMKALCEETSDFFEEHNVPCRKEGQRSSRWQLLDTGDIMVHLFTPQGREFYALERIWGDGEIFYQQQREAENILS